MTLLLTLGAVLAYAVIQNGARLPLDRCVMALAVALVAIIYFLRKRRYELAPRLEWWLRWPLALLLVYCALQLVPLPLALLRALSPARAEIAAAVGARWAPLSVAPTQAMLVMGTLAACVLTLLLARELAWRLEQRVWLAVAPIVVIAVLEAVLGLAQFYTNGPGGVAQGTYANRNHFSGLLEMALPLAVGYALGKKLTTKAEKAQRWGPALKATAAIGAAGLILAGIVHSLSRMGFTAALVGLGVGSVVLAARRVRHRAAGKKRWILATVVMAVVGVVALFVYLPPDELIARFAQLAESDEITADMRLTIWQESLQVVAAYPVFGCGLGGYEAAFLRYKKVAPLYTVDYAHNDYLQGLTELGLVGFALCLALVVGVFRKAGRWPALVAALAAIALHSCVDYNLHVPANAMAVAWIAGLGCE